MLSRSTFDSLGVGLVAIDEGSAAEAEDSAGERVEDSACELVLPDRWACACAADNERADGDRVTLSRPLTDTGT